MPLFNGSLNLAYQVGPGTTVALFSAADTIAEDDVSVVIAPVDAGPVARRSITFQCVGIGATIYGSNVAPTSAGPQDGVSVGTPTAGTAYQDTLGYAFYWAVAAAAGPGAVIAHVS